MNAVPQKAFCEGRFSQRINVFRRGEIVYTEDVGGSSPSSPTTLNVENVAFSGLFTNFPVGSMNLGRLE